jgi:phage terminase small subunit
MLTKKQKRFCSEYLIDLNATQAAIRAGYSKNSANEQAARMLAKASVQEYVSALMKKREIRTEITQDMVLKEYAKLAFLDPRKFYDDNGNLKNIVDLDADVAATLSGIDVVESKAEGLELQITKKIKFVDKKGALDSIARHLGMFNDKLQHTGQNGGPIDHNITVTFTKPNKTS